MNDLLTSTYMQPWYDAYRAQVYRQWRRKQGLPPDEGTGLFSIKITYREFPSTDANKAVTP